VNGEPGCERNRTCKFVAAFADFRYRRVAPDHGHDALDDKPKSKEESKRLEFKVCKFTTDAIITEGSDVGTVHKVCANLACPIHHPKSQSNRDDAKWKAEQEKQRREAAIANANNLKENIARFYAKSLIPRLET